MRVSQCPLLKTADWVCKSLSHEQVLWMTTVLSIHGEQWCLVFQLLSSRCIMFNTQTPSPTYPLNILFKLKLWNKVYYFINITLICDYPSWFKTSEIPVSHLELSQGACHGNSSKIGSSDELAGDQVIWSGLPVNYRVLSIFQTYYFKVCCWCYL